MEQTAWAWWALSVALIVVGLAGTVLPALPGVVFVMAGILVAAWIDDFQRITWLAVSAAGVLTVLAFALDYVAAIMGARYVKASRDAIIGAAIGTIAGLAMGLVGVLFMPFVGAAIGEYIARRNQPGALKVGLATWVGTMVGLVSKVVIAFMMIGIMIAALLV